MSALPLRIGTARLVDPRPCERQCDECTEWKHHSRFKLKTAGNSSVSRFHPVCRDCEQKARNEKKNADRPLAIISQRAASAASKVGVSKQFFWMHMNYRALVPEVRGLMTSEGLCKACGHQFLNERDIQIEHIEPPRFPQDWARLHARNLRFACASCNQTKGHKPFAQWLDEQEGARLSHHFQQPVAEILAPAQLSLFAEGT